MKTFPPPEWLSQSAPPAPARFVPPDIDRRPGVSGLQPICRSPPRTVEEPGTASPSPGPASVSCQHVSSYGVMATRSPNESQSVCWAGRTSMGESPTFLEEIFLPRPGSAALDWSDQPLRAAPELLLDALP